MVAVISWSDNTTVAKVLRLWYSNLNKINMKTDRLRPWIDLLVFLCTKDRRQILRHAFFHWKLPSVLSLRASRPNLVPRFSLLPRISGYTDSFQASSKVSIWGSHEKSHKSSMQEEIWVRGVLLSLVACFPGVGGWGILDISLGGEVRQGPSYPDPV